MLYTGTRPLPQATPLAQSMPITGRDLKAVLHGASSDDRARLAMFLVIGKWQLVWPTVPMAARVTGADPKRVHRMLGHPPRQLTHSEMIDWIRRHDRENVRQALAEIDTIVATIASHGTPEIIQASYVEATNGGAP
jgi:hypothetical protein